MNIRNRVFAYPVLSSDKEDYKDSEFDVLCDLKTVSVAYLQIDININLKSNLLQNLINNFKAEYVIHLECTSTGYRKILKGSDSHFIENIPVGNINEKLEIVCMILSKEDIDDFQSNEFDDDFLGEKFYISKSSILAYENFAYSLIPNANQFAKGNSIFSISKDMTDSNGKMSVELGQKKIIIRLRTDDYKLYANLGKKEQLQAIFQSMIILPALVYTIGELKIEGGIEMYETTEWYQSLKKV